MGLNMRGEAAATAPPHEKKERERKVSNTNSTPSEPQAPEIKILNLAFVVLKTGAVPPKLRRMLLKKKQKIIRIPELYGPAAVLPIHLPDDLYVNDPVIEADFGLLLTGLAAGTLYNDFITHVDLGEIKAIAWRPSEKQILELLILFGASIQIIKQPEKSLKRRKNAGQKTQPE
jgi:hypothetical protein